MASSVIVLILDLCFVVLVLVVFISTLPKNLSVLSNTMVMSNRQGDFFFLVFFMVCVCVFYVYVF